MDNTFLIGPFKQLLTLQNLPIKGALRDDDLEILDNGGLYIKNGLIEEVGNWGVLNQSLSPDIQRVDIDENTFAYLLISTVIHILLLEETEPMILPCVMQVVLI
jgi:hypothetical protein